MQARKILSGKELKNPEKHGKRFKLNVFSQKLPADVGKKFHAKLKYFAETLTDSAGEYFDSLVIANIADTDDLYDASQTRFSFNVTDQ